MAKAPVKAAPKKVAAKKVAVKKTTPKTEAASKASSPAKAPSVKDFDIEVAAKLALSKLQELNLDNHLQSDLKWCLGSYTHDKNPEGLHTMTAKAVALLEAEKDKNTKGVSAKFVADLQKALGK